MRLSAAGIPALVCLLAFSVGCAGAPPADELLRTAREACDSERWAEAAARYEAFAETGRAGRKEALVAAGECYKKAGLWKHAYEAFERVLEDYAAGAEADRALKEMFAIAAAFTEGRTEPSPVLPFLYLTSREWGAERLMDLAEHYPCRPEAQRAYGIVGVYRMNSGDYELALEVFDKVLTESADPAVMEEAVFYRGEVLFRSARGADYDVGVFERAERHFRDYLARSPTGRYRRLAEKRLSRIAEILARRELDTARFYIRRERPDSAAVALRYVLDRFPGTEAAREAGRLLAELHR